MSETQGLIVDVEARITKLERGLKKANETQKRAARQMERTAQDNARRIGQHYDSMGDRIGKSFGAMSSLFRVGGGLLAGGALAQQIRSYGRLADAATQMRNSLRNAGLEGDDLADVYARLFNSAQRNAAPVRSLVDLYSKLALTQKELGVSGDELIRFTDGVAVALRVAGTDAASASGALLQLSQALGGGTVRAEEFNSILEGTPTIAQAVARGLKEAGGSVAELRKLVIDGEVSSAAFFRAFEAGSAQLRQQAENQTATTGQAFTRLSNALVSAVGEFDQASGASDKFAQSVSDMAGAVESFDAAGFANDLNAIAAAFRDAEQAGTRWLNSIGNADVFAALNEAMGITEDGQLLNPDTKEAQQKIDRLESEVETLQKRVETNSELGFDNTEAIARLREVRNELSALRAEAANMPRYAESLVSNITPVNPAAAGDLLNGYEPPPAAPSVTPVSVQDFPAGGASGGGSGRAGGRSGDSGGGSGRSAQIGDLERATQAIKEQTQALQIEAAQLVLATAGQQDYGDAVEYARAKAVLLLAAQREGRQVTPELNAEIDGLARGYVEAGASAQRAADDLEKVEERGKKGAEALTGVFTSVLDGSKSAKQAVADLLMEIAKIQFQKALMGLFSGPLAGLSDTVGGLLGFSGGGFTGDGGKYEPAGVVHKGEYVFSKETVQRIGAGNLERLHQSARRGYASGGLVSAAGKVARATSDSPSASAKASAPQISITGGPITVNANGGTPEQNQDLAKQVARESEAAMRGMVQQEMVKQMRPGGLLR